VHENSIGLWAKIFPVFEVGRLSDSDAMLLLVKLLGQGRRQIASHWRKYLSEDHAWKRKDKKERWMKWQVLHLRGL